MCIQSGQWDDQSNKSLSKKTLVGWWQAATEESPGWDFSGPGSLSSQCLGFPEIEVERKVWLHLKNHPGSPEVVDDSVQIQNKRTDFRGIAFLISGDSEHEECVNQWKLLPFKKQKGDLNSPDGARYGWVVDRCLPAAIQASSRLGAASWCRNYKHQTRALWLSFPGAVLCLDIKMFWADHKSTWPWLQSSSSHLPKSDLKVTRAQRKIILLTVENVRGWNGWQRLVVKSL